MSVFSVNEATEQVLPIIASVPHSGLMVPEHLTAAFEPEALSPLAMTDWYVDKLYYWLPEMGVTTIVGEVSRLVIDLNRGAESKPLYPGRWESSLVPKQTFQGESVYRDYPDDAGIAWRKKQVHKPYHDQLQKLLDDTIAVSGAAVLFDLHSVASQANQLHGALEKDIYLGTRDGASASDALLQVVKCAFERADFSVSLNQPYKGGYITSHYGQSAQIQALQIEMSQDVYWSAGLELAKVPASKLFLATQARLRQVVADIIEALRYNRDLAS